MSERVDKLEDRIEITDRRSRAALDSNTQLQGEVAEIEGRVIGVVGEIRTEIALVSAQVQPVVDAAPLIKEIRDEQVARAAERAVEAKIRAEAEVKAKAEKDAAEEEDRKERLALQQRRTFTLKLLAIVVPVVVALASVITTAIVSRPTGASPPSTMPAAVDAGH